MSEAPPPPLQTTRRKRDPFRLAVLIAWFVLAAWLVLSLAVGVTRHALDPDFTPPVVPDAAPGASAPAAETQSP